MKKYDMIVLWLAGFGIPSSILTHPKFKIPFEENDAVDSLRALQSLVFDELPYDQARQAYTSLNNPTYQLEFLSFFSI